MENTYSIKNILRLLINKLWLIIILIVIGGGAAFAFSKFVLSLQYSSHITMYVQSYTGISENADNVNNISNSKQLVNTYMEVLKDDAVMNAVGDMLVEQHENGSLKECFNVNEEGKIDPESIRNCLTISSVNDTSAVKVVATTKDAELSAMICNKLTQIAPKYVEKAVGVGSLNTIDKAKIYKTPVAPNVTKNAVIGALAGMMTAILIIFLIDFFDNTIKDSEVISKKHQLAVLGEIQERGTKKSRKKDRDHYLITDKTVPFHITESYKAMRTNLMFSLSTTDKKIVAVSSALPGEGKSTIAANLAIAFSQLNENKVLLIDADMRKPVQHKLFNVKNNAGIAEFLGKMKPKAECIRKSGVPNLDIITSGSLPPNPSELLASEQMEKLLTEMSAEYDYVIIDMPPVNIVSDPLTIGRSISGMIAVTHYGKTTHDDFADMMRKVQTSDTKILGFVLNEIKSRNSGKYGYSKKYKYYSYDDRSKKKDENKEDKHAD